MITLYLKNLRFSHGKKDAEFHCDFVFSNEQPLAIRGESGVGKSTLLDLISGFLKPHGGEIYLTNKAGEITLMPLSYLRQDAPLFDHLSVQKNIGFSRACRDDIYEMAEDLSIRDLLKKKAGELSGGQRQRVLLAQTLLQKRPLILLDEPFKGLDRDNKDKALKAIKKAADQEDHLLVFTTHDARDVAAFQAREVIL
jgi:ABC-type thiamine transport system ATPase subunit